ncbi:MAG: Uma2 family endonuclease [Acidobacteria bacterium]|nr:Uma2 family endonuclease [Acidobacteriota bacterium]
MIKAMSPAATLVSVDEYLRTSYKPACEYRDGVLTQKTMPTRKHSKLQFRVNKLIDANFPGFEAGPEITVRLRPDRYLVPDVAVQRIESLQDPYPVEPIHLCVEILSPEDRFSETVSKAEEYLAWGVPTVWIVDPDKQMAWSYDNQRGLHDATAHLIAGEISISLADLFAGL